MVMGLNEYVMSWRSKTTEGVKRSASYLHDMT